MGRKTPVFSPEMGEEKYPEDIFSGNHANGECGRVVKKAL